MKVMMSVGFFLTYVAISKIYIPIQQFVEFKGLIFSQTRSLIHEAIPH